MLSWIPHIAFPWPSHPCCSLLSQLEGCYGWGWSGRGRARGEEQERGTAFQSATCTSQLAIDPSTLLVSGCSSAPRQCLITNFLNREKKKNISFLLTWTHIFYLRKQIDIYTDLKMLWHFWKLLGSNSFLELWNPRTCQMTFFTQEREV